MLAFVQRICVFATATVGLIAQTAPVAAGQQTLSSGMVGIVEGQIARLNVLNPGVVAPAVVCPAALKFLDSQGALLKSTSVTVLPGKSASFDLFGDVDLALVGDDRREIRSTITIPPVVPPPGAATPQPAPCALIGTLEVIDRSSGKTQVVLGGMHVVQSPVVAAGNP